MAVFLSHAMANLVAANCRSKQLLTNDESPLVITSLDPVGGVRTTSDLTVPVNRIVLVSGRKDGILGRRAPAATLFLRFLQERIIKR